MIDRPDPYPRELIDVWPLHDARRELLEEIVSQPGPAQSPSTRRILVPVGIAAALLLVVGGAWAAISAGGADKQVSDLAAASGTSRADDPTTAPTSAATATDEPSTDPTRKPRHDGKRGHRVPDRAVTLRNLEQCLHSLSRRIDGPRDHLRLRRLEHADGRSYQVYVVRKDHRIIAVDGHCRTRLVRGGRH